MTYQIGQFINGKSLVDNSLQILDIRNPATGEIIGEVQLANNSIINNAVETAKVAFEQWSQTPAQKRVRVLFRYKQLLEKKIDKLGDLVTLEHGKTLEDARGSVMRGIELTEFCCGMPYLMRGSYSENVANNVDCYSIRQPLGVCVGVSPFNFPVMVPVWMFVPAIAAGNTFILKPSEQDPSPVMLLADLMHQAGCPPGVLNIINGDKNAVDTLCQHPDVCAITAVASSPVAKHIQHSASAHSKRSATYGGAKNHAIIMPDADLEHSAEAILGAAYGSAGERCMAISVAVAVGDTVADKLVAYLKAKIPEIKIGPGHKKDVTMGPLISQTHLDRVTSFIETGEKEGATLVVDGRKANFGQHPGGYFLGGSLFDNVTPNMKIYQEEIFGPVLCIVRADDFSSAVDLASNHPYGNGTAIFTNDGEVARNFASNVQVGMVGINVPIPVPIAYHSFGGWKQSMFGDIAMHGDQSVLFYTKVKTITSRWPKGLSAQADYAMPHLDKES